MKKETDHKFVGYFITFTWHADRAGTFGVMAVKILIAILFSIDTLAFSKVIDTLTLLSSEGKNISMMPFLLVLAVWITKAVLQIVYKAFKRRISMRLSRELSLRVIDKKSKMKYSVLENKANWDLFERIGNDPSEQWSLSFFNLLEILMYIVEIGSIVVLIASKSILLAILVGLLFVPYYVIALKNGREEYSAYEESTAHFRRANYYRKVLSGREYVNERTLFGFSEWINGLWNQEYSQAVDIEKRANGKVFLRNAFANIASALFIGVLSLFMLLPLKQGFLTSGFYIAVLKAMIQFINALSLNFSQMAIELEKSKLRLQDFQNFENLEEDSTIQKPPMGIKRIETIAFENVSFSYPNEEKQVLDHMSFVLYGDRQYAFVGENGAGKTTIMKLLTGFYDDYAGSIKINGMELRQIPKDELHSLFSIVYQDYAKYEISLSKNLVPGIQAQTDHNQVEQILRKTGLDGLLAKCPEGIDTRLGKLDENGVDLSAGQWQMIAIARCLLSQTLIHILDEPTSAIDPVLEVTIYRIFKECLAEQFAIFITHRLGAAKLADEILVLSNGKVIEQGTHDSLLEKQGVYCHMFETQRSWYVEET